MAQTGEIVSIHQTGVSVLISISKTLLELLAVTFWDDRNDRYFDLGNGYTGKISCQNSLVCVCNIQG